MPNLDIATLYKSETRGLFPFDLIGPQTITSFPVLKAAGINSIVYQILIEIGVTSVPNAIDILNVQVEESDDIGFSSFSVVESPFLVGEPKELEGAYNADRKTLTSEFSLITNLQYSRIKIDSNLGAGITFPNHYAVFWTHVKQPTAPLTI